MFFNGGKIIIISQPYAYSFNGTTYVLCYDYRYKDHYAQDWEESPYSLNNSYPLQSNSTPTIMSLPEFSISQPNISPPPPDFQIDFQVEAIAGHYYQTESGTFISPDETSGWSPTKTVTLPLYGPPMTESPPAPSSNPAQQLPSLSPTVVIIAVVVIIVIAVAVYVIFKKKRPTNRANWRNAMIFWSKSSSSQDRVPSPK